MSHFSSSLRVHNGGCTNLLYVLYFLSFYEQHIVPRRIIPSCILYNDVLEAICNIEIGYLIGGLWERPHDSWCAPLAPNCTFMFMFCKMIVATYKWLEEHFLSFDLIQARDALCWFLVWDLDPLSGCHLATCSYCTMFPCIADMFIFMGRFIWRVGLRLRIPIGIMIILTIHVVHFRRSHGPTMNATLHFFPSCGRDHLKNLRRHSMDHEEMEELA